jgi:hypothetical protein
MGKVILSNGNVLTASPISAQVYLDQLNEVTDSEHLSIVEVELDRYIEETLHSWNAHNQKATQYVAAMAVVVSIAASQVVFPSAGAEMGRLTKVAFFLFVGTGLYTLLRCFVALRTRSVGQVGIRTIIHPTSAFVNDEPEAKFDLRFARRWILAHRLEAADELSSACHRKGMEMAAAERGLVLSIVFLVAACVSAVLF